MYITRNVHVHEHVYLTLHTSPRAMQVCGTGDPYNLLLASIWGQQNHRNTSDDIRK